MGALPWHAHVDVWFVFASLAAGYLVLCRRHLARTGEATPRRRKVLFLTGIGLLWLVSDWPMHDLAEQRLYAAHMVQHMVYTLVAAPLIVTGVPAWLWRSILSPAPLHTVFRFLTRPLVALLLFNGVLLLTHWPAVVTASVGSELTHFLLHVLVVVSAMIMWWPVVSPLPELPALSPPGQMLYLFLQSLAPTIPASFLTFGRSPLYHVYEAFPRIWGITALNDQLMAGLIMKLIGGFILWGVIAAVFFRWAAREQAEDWDEVRWGKVDREITAGLHR
ncbi:MAG TPA: cytochrome c oxidase assembly protein [Actinomycetota bacterium]|jgi:putative membrane protein